MEIQNPQLITPVQHLNSIMETLKDLEKQESELKHEVLKLEEKVAAGCDDEHDIAHDLSEELQRLDFSKRELAAKLRAILSVKRKLEDVPSQSELVQYERRFSELYTQIQEKHQQTQKLYATYNALLEIKELMLKETSLLNSISSQFQDAITSSAGRMKLIDSMEKIVKGSQQKLEKLQVGLREEQKLCDTLKEKHATAVAEQRKCHSLLKSFQEECAKNERLRNQNSSYQHYNDIRFRQSWIPSNCRLHTSLDTGK